MFFCEWREGELRRVAGAPHWGAEEREREFARWQVAVQRSLAAP